MAGTALSIRHKTNSSVANAVGSRIWFISGIGSPKRYRLCSTFIADGSEPSPDFGKKHRLFGERGERVEPPVVLNSEALFSDLEATQFFSRGLVEIRASKRLTESQASQIIAGLEAFTSQTLDDESDVDADLVDLAEVEDQLREELVESWALSGSERALRLAEASPFPQRVEVYTTAYLRNADVIVTVLRRANGSCERCKQKAPFLRRSDGNPYLEVHHLKPLSEGGEDTVENAAAICPNCHREAHHGLISS